MCSCSGGSGRKTQPQQVKRAAPTPAPAPNPDIPTIQEGTNQHLLNMQIVQAAQQQRMQTNIINRRPLNPRPISR